MLLPVGFDSNHVWLFCHAQNHFRLQRYKIILVYARETCIFLQKTDEKMQNFFA